MANKSKIKIVPTKYTNLHLIHNKIKNKFCIILIEKNISHIFNKLSMYLKKKCS
jgi:hypothetical protein